MISQDPTHVVIIGASFAGLLAATAVAAAGARVTVLDRDDLPPSGVPRPGVPQGRQPHILLHRGMIAAESLLPGFCDDLVRAGAVRLDTGRMPTLGEFGWMPTSVDTYDILSLTRPLVEYVVRRRVTALPEVTLQPGAKVTGLVQDGRGWRVELGEQPYLSADVVIDASGRGSRLPHWLTALGYPEPQAEQVDSRLGYASQLYRAREPFPPVGGLVIATTPQTGAGGLALPVENHHWLVLAVGYGDSRPSRDSSDFEPFLGRLRDPALLDLVRCMEPVGELAVHRQTGNRRLNYGQSADWPDGLLVVGDALCAFNPVYGQGITVAASQAQVLRNLFWTLTAGQSTRAVQRQLAAVAELPWAIATSEDLRHPSSSGVQSKAQGVLTQWSIQLGRLAVGGDPKVIDTFARVYHLMGSPLLLFSPDLVRAVARAQVTGFPRPAPRPAVLDELVAAQLAS